MAAEGPNDGLVSVTSSQWGEYKGTLDNVSHLDLINWTNRLRWWFWELTGTRRSFNAIAFYLHITGKKAQGASHAYTTRMSLTAVFIRYACQGRPLSSWSQRAVEAAPIAIKALVSPVLCGQFSNNLR